MKGNGSRAISRRDVLIWGAGLGCASALRASPLAEVLLGTVPSPPPSRALRDVSTYLSRLEGFGFSGALLVTGGDTVLLRSLHGLADQETGRRWRSDTVLDIGSCAKQFTAAAILALEADGKLRTSDPVSKHLVGVPADKSAMTIHHLLTHTAGLRLDFGDDYDVIARDPYVAGVLAAPLLRKPGEKHAYSNAGYSLLAAIVEIVSGTSLDRFLRERLFGPSGMTSSGYQLSDAEARRVARGYEDGEDARLLERAQATRGQMWNLLGNGGIYTTLEDLQQWAFALRGDAVLPAASRQKFFQPHVLVNANYLGSGTQLFYGYGWYVSKSPAGKTLIWHLGGNRVTNAGLRFHLDEQRWIVYGTNVSEFNDPQYPVPAVERIIAGESVEAPPKVRPLAPRPLARFAGTYRAPGGALLTLAVHRGFLLASGEGQEAFAFVADGQWTSSAELGALNAAAAQAIEASRLGQVDAVAKHFGPWIAKDELAASEAAFWTKRHDRLGDYRRTRVLGTSKPTGRRYVGRTIVAVDFSRGSTWREYFWTKDGLVGDVGPIEKPPAGRFFPVSATCLVAFDPAAATSAKLCLDAGREGGTVAIAGTDIVLRRTR